MTTSTCLPTTSPKDRARIVKALQAVIAKPDQDAATARFIQKVEAGEEGAAISRKRSDVILEPGFTLAALYERRSPPKPLPITQDGYVKACFRVWIKEPTVDLMEAFIDTVTAPLGLKVHYIDDWSLHTASGGVHCGSNAIRTPPSRPWWNDDPQSPYPAYKVLE
jgi:hypothetical protein